MSTGFIGIEDVFRARRTTKALSDVGMACPDRDPEDIEAVLEAARWAPFHKPAAKQYRSRELGAVVPWRSYVLEAEQCRILRRRLLASGDDSKLPKLLAVADHLIQVTWLPEAKNEGDESLFEPSIQNMEHIAAASSAVQNMLLAATARTIPNYWSSGGALRSAEVFTMLGIPQDEVLLASVFLFPRDLSGVDSRPGSLRGAHAEVCEWARFVSL